MVRFVIILACWLFFTAGQAIATTPTPAPIEQINLQNPTDSSAKNTVATTQVNSKTPTDENKQPSGTDQGGNLVESLATAIAVLTLMVTMSIPVLINFYRILKSELRELTDTNKAYTYINNIVHQYTVHEIELLEQKIENKELDPFSGIPQLENPNGVTTLAAKELAYIHMQASSLRSHLEALISRDKTLIRNAHHYLSDTLIDDSAKWLRELKSYLNFVMSHSFFNRKQHEEFKKLERDCLQNVAHELPLLPRTKKKAREFASHAIKSGAIALIAFATLFAFTLILIRIA